jgi:hypothetical protein
VAASISSDQLARKFLAEVGANPDNANLRRAVRVWKSSEGRSICGNNPWFIRHTTFARNRDGSAAGRLCVNKATRACAVGVSGPAYDCNFSQFKSLDDGVWATAQVLKLPRYRKVVAALKAGNAVRFLHELGASGWAAGGYNNALVGRFNTLTNAYMWNLPLVAGSDGGSSGPNPDAVPGASTIPAATTYTAAQWNAFIACLGFPSTEPAKHAPYIIKPTDVPQMVKCATANNIQLTAGDFAPFVGKSVSDLRDGLAAKGTIPPLDVLGGLPDVLGSLGKVLAFLLDVENLGYVMAMFVGGGLALYGFAQIAGIQGPRVGMAKAKRTARKVL